MSFLLRFIMANYEILFFKWLNFFSRVLFSKNTIAIQLIPKKNTNLGLLNCTGTSYTAKLLKLYEFMETNYSSIQPKVCFNTYIIAEN